MSMKFWLGTRCGILCAGALALVVLLPLASRAELTHPDLQTAKPQAACKLQSLSSEPTSQAMRPAVAFGYAPASTDDRLANYQRTSLGDWQMASEVDRDDPWLRLVLLAQRPVVIDVAVIVDGKPYSNVREAWIDEVLSPKASEPSKEQEQHSEEPADTDKKDTDKKKVIVPAVTDDTKVAAESRHAPSMRQRVSDYVTSAGSAVDRSEIRWLIAEWGFGPPVVLLDQRFSWQRAEVAPLLVCIDTDRSGALEAAEIAAAPAVLQRVDANADDVVEESELERKATKPPVLPFDSNHPLLVMIDDATDLEALAATCARLYGYDSQKLDELLNGVAEATFRVEFGADASAADAVKVFADAANVDATDDTITYDLGAEYVEFSAAGPTSKNDATDSATDSSTTQIALGAVVDGNPLLRVLDSDHDQRLSQRERQQLPKLLSSLDRNSDGQVAAAELPIPIRLAVTVGPNVDRLLAKPTGAKRALATAAPPASSPKSPDWFISMDGNADGDLSRTEFLGTSEQFGQFDADGDGLLSVGEAVKMMPGE